MFEVDVAVAKVGKYATSESGDTFEMVERPRGGLSFVLADGQRSGKSAKFISNLVARKAISPLGEGVRDEAAARAAAVAGPPAAPKTDTPALGTPSLSAAEAGLPATKPAMPIPEVSEDPKRGAPQGVLLGLGVAVGLLVGAGGGYALALNGASGWLPSSCR